MTRKSILILIAIFFALSACTPAENIGDELNTSPISPTETKTQSAPEKPTPYPDLEEPTPYPELSDGLVQENPTPYPEPDKPSLAPTVDPYPGPEDVEWPMNVTDDLGNTFEIQAYPKRIVSLSPSTTEILFAIGAGNQVVGRDDFSVFPEAALNVESIGSLWESVPTEAILALEPDLVIAAQIVSEENIQVLVDLGLPVYWQKNPADFQNLYENLLAIAEITGHTDETQIMITDLQARVDSVVMTIASAKDAPAVFYELDATDPANPWTTGSGTFIDYIITMAGGMNAAATLQGDYAQISAEELIHVNPETILLADALYGVTPDSVAARPGWDVILAVQNGKIYPIDPNLMSVPGPRLVDALEETARLIHPELFE